MGPRIYIALRRQGLSDAFLDAYRKRASDILDGYVPSGLKGAFEVGFPSLKFSRRDPKRRARPTIP